MALEGWGHIGRWRELPCRRREINHGFPVAQVTQGWLPEWGSPAPPSSCPLAARKAPGNDPWARNGEFSGRARTANVLYLCSPGDSAWWVVGPACHRSLSLRTDRLTPVRISWKPVGDGTAETRHPSTRVHVRPGHRSYPGGGDFTWTAGGCTGRASTRFATPPQSASYGQDRGESGRLCLYQPR